MKKKMTSIMKLAGSWKMSDEEWEKIRRDIKRNWKGWKTKSKTINKKCSY